MRCMDVVIFIVMLICLSVFIHVTDYEWWQKDAIKHNKAEYYLDSDNNRQWRWKP